MERTKIIKTLIGATCLSLAAATLSVVNVAASAEASVSENELRVIGASVRLDSNATAEDDDGTGLKFCLRASESYLEKADEVGMLLIPETKLTGELTVATEGAVKNVKAYVLDGDPVEIICLASRENGWKDLVLFCSGKNEYSM